MGSVVVKNAPDAKLTIINDTNIVQVAVYEFLVILSLSQLQTVVSQ